MEDARQAPRRPGAHYPFNKAVAIAWTDRVSRLDEELEDLEALLARISR